MQRGASEWTAEIIQSHAWVQTLHRRTEGEHAPEELCRQICGTIQIVAGPGNQNERKWQPPGPFNRNPRVRRADEMARFRS